MTAELMVLFAKLLSGANARWIGCGPETKQRIYFANHTSNLDALVLWAVLPPTLRAVTRPVAARDYWTATKIRQYMATHVLRAILIERKKPTARDNPITQILDAMGKTESIIIFPEGGRFTQPDPMPFKSGIYHLAQKRPNVELVPVLMDNLNRILPKGEVLPVPLLGSVTIGKPIQLLTSESKNVFLERARQEIINLRNI